MPLYEYSCAAGHVTSRVLAMKARHPKSVKCGSCPKRARRSFAPAAVRPDFPEHWNISMGCIVKNRKHHEQLQRERGLQDWIPLRESPMFGKLRKEGHAI